MTSTPSLLVLLLCILSNCCNAQPPQDIHPWQTECGNYGCFINWFCVPSIDLCIECPNAGFGTTEKHCQGLFQMANASIISSEDTYYYTNDTEHQIDVDSCLRECVKPQGGDACTDQTGCDPGCFFCNYEETTEAEEAVDDQLAPIVREGTCQPCKQDVSECLDDPNINSPFGMEQCVLCDIGVCVPLHFSVTSEVNEDGSVVEVDSTALQGSPSLVATGPLVSCNNLVHREEQTCVPGGNDLPPEETSQEGKICLVHDFNKNSYFVSVVNKCAAMGGVAVVMFQENLSRVPNNETWTGSLSYLPTTIPSVVVSYDKGMEWELERLDQLVTVNVTDVGEACFEKQFCNDDIPCVGSSAGQYCDYKWGGGDGGNGFCRECPIHPDTDEPDPLQCFFNIRDGDEGKIMGQSGVESCSSTCAGELEFPACKFCPEDVSGFDFGLEDESDEKCRFCPNNDVLYPDKDFPLFGEDVKCWMVQKFFDSVDVKEDSRNCELAQMMNYVCGCTGSGYLGANTLTKKRVLAWLPRVMAIMSLFGSSLIIYDNLKSPDNRQKTMNQLLIGLSVFDLMGSGAYALTTLPIPEDHPYGPIYGAKGNEATCKAQGWFIQMGTISAYMNVSLAVYYFLVIKFGWDEGRVRKIRWALYLGPLAVGFAFAFAGIPYYDSLNLWCNNTATYWPDIPVAVAIGVATILMSLVCWDVYVKERAAAKWRADAVFKASASKSQESLPMRKTSILSRVLSVRSSMTRNSTISTTAPQRQTLSTRVFWQSFFYLMAFYLTWPPYLALQYAWAGGSSFTDYGLILTAATLVPLQGFWNMLVYIRPRYVNKSLEKLRKRRASRTKSTQSKEGGSRWSWLTPSKRGPAGVGSTDEAMPPLFGRSSTKGSTGRQPGAQVKYTSTGNRENSTTQQDVEKDTSTSFHWDNREEEKQEEE